MIKSSDKNKLSKLYIETDKNKNDTNQTTKKNKLVNTTVKKYLVAWDVFASTHNFGTDWETMTIMIGANDSWVGHQFIAWEINFGVIDEKFLPFIKIEVLTNNTTDLRFSTLPSVSKFFTMDENTGATILKVGVFYADFQLREINPLQVKLFVIFDRVPITQKQDTPTKGTFTYSYFGVIDEVVYDGLYGDGKTPEHPGN